MTIRLTRALLVLGAVAGVAGALVAQAPGERSVWAGVYDEDQATRGKAAYAENCASCHGAALSGIDVAPPLSGAGFLGNWNGTSAADLFTRIKTTMPLTAPGSLSGRTVSDIEAYLFQANGFPSGSVALPPAPPMMAGIKITAQKPN